MQQSQCLTIGMEAPDFEEQSTFGPIKLSDYKGNWLVFFSHPAGFTPVCTTEFLSFSQHVAAFENLGVQLLGLSIDSNAAHLAWMQSILETTGVMIPFPVVADRSGKVAALYGMVAPNVNTQATVRNVFIIDPAGIIRAILVYPMTCGRNIEEILRMVESMQYSDESGMVTPADWQPGELGMMPAPNTVGEMCQRTGEPVDKDLSCNTWYWCYNTKQHHI